MLIDECRTGGWAAPSPVTTRFPRKSWARGIGIENGELLALAVENGFDVFLTGDRNLTFQQNVTEFAIAIGGIGGKGRSTGSTPCP